MDRFDWKGPNEKYPLPFEDNTIYCECGNVAKYRAPIIGEWCKECDKDVIEEHNPDPDDVEEI